MNITPVRNNINFGYSSRFQKRVLKEIAKSDDPRAKLVLKKEKELMKIEDKVVKLEKHGMQNTDLYKNYTDYLVQCKTVNSYFIEMMNSDLSYCDRQIPIYINESRKCHSQEAQDWRMELCRYLNSYSASEYFPESFGLIKKQDEVDQEESKESQEDIQKDDIISMLLDGSLFSEEDEISSIMPLYVPNEFSPKTLDDVVGSNDIKEKLKDDLIYYMQSPEQVKKDYEEYGIRAPRGFLFYGPPGCGKTCITQALANQIGVKMYMMDVSKVGSMYVNQTSKNIREAFDHVFKMAKESEKPIIIFMDEADALAINRNSSLSGSGENAKTTATLLKMIESSRDNNTIVIAATNRYDTLDQAFKDRFDGQIYFPLPDEEQIKNLLKVSLSARDKGGSLANDSDNIEKLAKMLKGYSNRSIVILMDDASKIARRRSRDEITFDDVKAAIERTQLEKPNEKEYQKQSDNKRTIGFTN